MRLPYKAPPPAALWTGFYAGLHGGASWGSKSFDYNDFTPGAPFVWESSIPVNGGLAGGQLGYNLQFGSWLIGVEADASWADINGKGLCNTTVFFVNCAASVDGLTTPSHASVPS